MVHTQSTVSANWKKSTKYSSQSTNAINRQIYYYEGMENKQHKCSYQYNWFCPFHKLDSNILTYFNTYNMLPDIAALLCQYVLSYFYNYSWFLRNHKMEISAW